MIVLSGVTVFSQGPQAGMPQVPASARFMGIPKGGAGILETRDLVIVYDQGRGKGKIISKITTRNGDPVMTEFVIR